MKSTILSLSVLIVVAISACGVSKKSTPAAPVTPAVPVVVVPPRPVPSVHSSDGIFPPGTAELSALQVSHKEVTMETLKEGYKLYTGICTNCHLAKSIYDRPRSAWPEILTSMAKEANIIDAQKDAIYQYVLSIKATQPK